MEQRDLGPASGGDSPSRPAAGESDDPGLAATVIRDPFTPHRPRTVIPGTVLPPPTPTPSALAEAQAASAEAASVPAFESAPAYQPTPQAPATAYDQRDVEYISGGGDGGGFPPRNTGFDDAPGNGPGRGPKRWVLVTSAALAAIALASTAAAIAAQDSGSRPAAAGQTGGVTTTTSDAPSGTPDGAQSASGSDSGTTAGSATSPSPSATTTTKAATTTTTSPTPSATKTSATPSSTTSSSAATNGDSETSCEAASHDTAADEAVKFTGMTRGTQAAFLAAKADAQKAGVTFTLNSGYRTAAYQQRIFDCWVKQLGSAQAARKYALPPSESAHVKGYAMDIAPQSAAAWLEASAGKYGLCRRYTDEPWHFEYQSTYKTKGCPALLPQP